MFVRIGAWIVWVYVAFGLILVLAAYGAFAVYQHGARSWSRAEQLPVPAAGEYAMRSAGQLETAYAPALLVRANERLVQSQAMLEKMSASLQEKNQLLNHRTAECRALQRDLEQTLAFITDLLNANGMENGDAGSVDQSLRSAPIMRQLEEEMASLRDDLAKGELFEQEQAAEVEQLRNLLLQTEAEIMQLQSLATSELEAISEEKETLTAEREMITTAARQSLLRAGATAIPGLIDQLADDQPVVRQWAAATLGELGAAAQDALPALTALLADRDAKVREAAQQALEHITVVEPR